MKRFFNHIFLGRMADRTDDEFIGMADTHVDVKPEALRWFSGMDDLNYTFVCRAL
ncbi:MAG: hypothetical protein IJH78_04810 [Clostridia bacterium]|nr:hypothetical protein [Clostridia bacterium]